MKEHTKMIIRENLESLVIAFILAMIIRAFVVQAYKIPTGSMIPTLKVGDRILVSKFIYKFWKPQRGDVIVFKYPKNPRVAYIKRLIGLPGEKIQINNGHIYINGKEIEQKNINCRFYYNYGKNGEVGEVYQIPPKSYFALGDNSANSRDSRYWGVVPKKNLIGRAFFIYWPPNRIRVIR